ATLKSRLADVNALHSAVTMMDWDQQTFMPRGGAAARAQHIGILSRMAHETLIADETLAALNSASGENEDDVAMIRVTKRNIDL
ncbi:hypothetical protein ACP3WM_24380, partial [Salmonella enterica]